MAKAKHKTHLEANEPAITKTSQPISKLNLDCKLTTIQKMASNITTHHHHSGTRPKGNPPQTNQAPIPRAPIPNWMAATTKKITSAQPMIAWETNQPPLTQSKPTNQRHQSKPNYHHKTIPSSSNKKRTTTHQHHPDTTNKKQFSQTNQTPIRRTPIQIRWQTPPKK